MHLHLVGKMLFKINACGKGAPALLKNVAFHYVLKGTADMCFIECKLSVVRCVIKINDTRKLAYLLT
jgi:hypothetical protein